jgi:PadR family transcriptional regulator, regulatory protein AphA
MVKLMLKYILLGFIHDHPATGYELKQALDHTTGYFWHAYHSQIYTTLRKLEEEGLIVSQVVSGQDHLTRRIYQITPLGQETLQQWQNEPLTEKSQIKEDLLVRIFFSDLRPASDVLAELRLQRKLHKQQLMLYQSIKFHNNGKSPAVKAEKGICFHEATRRFGLAYEQMYIQWLDDLIKDLETA